MVTLWRNKLIKFLVILLLVLAVLFFLTLLTPLFRWLWNLLQLVVTPFLAGLIVAYLLKPVVDLLHSRKVPRATAVLLIYGSFMLLLSLILVNMVPMFSVQMRGIIEQLPKWSEALQLWINQVYEQREFLPEALQESIDRAIGAGEAWLSDWFTKLFTHLDSTVEQVVIFFTIPFVTFYLLKDFEVIERSVMAFVPKAQRKGFRRMLREMDQALGSYIRGQLWVALAVGIMSYIGYLIIGLPFALVMALIVGLMDIIPYVGPYIGALPALFMGLTVSPQLALWVIVVNVSVQFVEGNFLSPHIVGRTVHLHPLAIIFAVLIGGKVAGLIGALLAVPFVAVMKVVVEHLFAYVIHERSKKPEQEQQS